VECCSYTLIVATRPESYTLAAASTRTAARATEDSRGGVLQTVRSVGVVLWRRGCHCTTRPQMATWRL
jgi:hypothetical protein